MDATCVLINIRYPQDLSLLNEAREKLEVIIWRFCKDYSLTLPRRYAKRMGKDYLAYAKCRRHTQSRHVRRSKNSLPMYAETWHIWTTLCQRDMLPGKRISRHCWRSWNCTGSNSTCMP